MKRNYAQGITECEGTCGRKLRSSHTPLSEAPGTVKRHANGMCESCDTKHGKVRPVKQDQTIIPCRNCKHPTRPVRMSLRDAPGTRARVGDLCRPCDSACSFVSSAEVTAAAQALEAYLRARRARGVPAEGHGHLELAA